MLHVVSYAHHRLALAVLVSLGIASGAILLDVTAAQARAFGGS